MTIVSVPKNYGIWVDTACTKVPLIDYILAKLLTQHGHLITDFHWNVNDIFTKFSPYATPEVKIPTFSAAADENFC